MNYTEWLANLKVGDKVAISNRYGYKSEIVARLTKTQVVLENGVKFNRESCRRIGDDAWTFVYLVPLTAEIRAEWRREWLLNELSNYNIKQTSNENLEKIVALLRELGVEKYK